MSVVAVDGEAVQPADADSIELSAGQRYDVVITAKDNNSENYAINSQQVGSSFSNTGTLKYSDKASLQSRRAAAALSTSSLDDISLIPADNQGLLEPVSETIELNVHNIRTKAGPRYVSSFSTQCSLILS